MMLCLAPPAKKSFKCVSAVRGICLVETSVSMEQVRDESEKSKIKDRRKTKYW